MIDTLIILVCLSSLFTKNKIAIFFSAILLTHNTMSTNFDGWFYYISAAICDLLFIGIAALFIRPCYMVSDLLCLSFCSILLNFYGWLIWYNYLPPQSYINGFIFLYSLAILIIIGRQGARIDFGNIFRSVDNKSSLAYKNL